MHLSIGNCLYLGLSDLSEVPKTMTYMTKSPPAYFLSGDIDDLLSSSVSFGLPDCHHDSDICQWGTRGKEGRGRGHKGLLRYKSVVRAIGINHLLALTQFWRKHLVGF